MRKIQDRRKPPTTIQKVACDTKREMSGQTQSVAVNKNDNFPVFVPNRSSPLSPTKTKSSWHLPMKAPKCPPSMTKIASARF
mmetsp:Transcript_18433/g.33380  ORF Transcript_18433/g.33380 Transcript_18433/m.33380 type:complete len:82 (+) Transcript_18433:7-252(+)